MMTEKEIVEEMKRLTELLEPMRATIEETEDHLKITIQGDWRNNKPKQMPPK